LPCILDPSCGCPCRETPGWWVCLNVCLVRFSGLPFPVALFLNPVRCLFPWTRGPLFGVLLPCAFVFFLDLTFLAFRSSLSYLSDPLPLLTLSVSFSRPILNVPSFPFLNFSFLCLSGSFSLSLSFRFLWFPFPFVSL